MNHVPGQCSPPSDAAEQHEQMGAGDDAEGVELQTTQGAHDVEKAVRVRRGSRPGEALLMDG